MGVLFAAWKPFSGGENSLFSMLKAPQGKGNPSLRGLCYRLSQSNYYARRDTFSFNRLP